MSSSCADSVSFPNTMTKSTKPFQMGSKVFKFQPVRSDVLLRQLMEEEEDSPKPVKTSKPKTQIMTHRGRQANQDSFNTDDEDADEDILNQTIIEPDSIIKDDLVPGVTWLETPPITKPLKIIAKPVPSTPMTNMFNKLSIRNQYSARKESRAVSADRKVEDKLMQTPVINNNLFKTPICQNSKIIPNSSTSQRHLYSERNAIHSTNNHTLSATKKQLESKSKQKLQIQLNKNLETPRPSIIQSAISRNVNASRPTLPSTIKEDRIISSSAKKMDAVLREKNMNVFTMERQKSKEIIVPEEKHLNKQPNSAIKQPNKQLNNELKQLVNKQSSNNEIKQSVIKQSNIVERKQLSNSDLKQLNRNESKQPLNKQQNEEKQLTNKQSCVQINVPVKPLQESTFQQLKVRGKEYIITNKIGEGGSGQVFRCLEQETFQHRAIKVVNLNVDAGTVNSYMNEVKMLSKLQGNDRVIRMYDFEQVNQNLYVVMEIGDIDFSIFLRNITTEHQVQTHIIICYWIEMLKCVREIHNQDIIHSDLKPSNFLIVGGRLKLIDFGIATGLSAEMTSVIKNVTVGTINYISPEALLDSRESPTDGKPQLRISYKSDVWSLGCILYQMVYKRTPFHAVGNMWTKLAVITDRNHKIEYQQIPGVPLYLIDMIKKCLVYDMRSRPTVDELLNIWSKLKMYYDENYF